MVHLCAELRAITSSSITAPTLLLESLYQRTIRLLHWNHQSSTVYLVTQGLQDNILPIFKTEARRAARFFSPFGTYALCLTCAHNLSSIFMKLFPHCTNEKRNRQRTPLRLRRDCLAGQGCPNFGSSFGSSFRAQAQAPLESLVCMFAWFRCFRTEWPA